VSIHSPPSGLRTNQPSVNVAFYVNGSSTIPSAVTCTVNGAPTTTPSTNSVVLNPGTNNIPVVCTSAGGQGSASVTVIRDVQPPTIGPISVSLISPTQARITYSAFDDSGQPPECIPPSGSIIPLQPGPNQITVNCRDQAGNVATSVVTIVVDPPQPFSVTITSGPTGTIFTPTATFTYQASEPLETTMQCPVGTVCPAVMVTRVTLQCILDGGAGTPCPINNALGGTYTTPQLLTGNHTFCVRGTRIADGAVAQDCRTFTVMNEPPPPPQCSVSGNTLTCTWTTPPGFVATCSLDGGPSASCVSPWVRPGLPPGVHNAQICLVGPSGSSCMSYPFTIAEVRPIVTITSPTNGSITTVSSVPLNFTVAGGVPPYICSRTSGTQVPLTIGSNTITVTCQGFDGSTGIASVTVTRQALTEFNPTYEQTYNSDPATLETGVTFSLNNPITSNPIKTAVVALPSAVQPNYPAFGSIQDRCAASAIVLTPAPVFSKSNCPAAARLGTVTLSSPAYSTPLHGDVYLVDRQPIPWLGVDFSDPSLGNPTNITWPQLVLRTSYPQVDPSCVPDETTLCPSVIKFDISGLPDVQALQSTFAITGPDRSGSTGTLPGKLFRFETEVCDTINSTATLGSTANESVTRSSVISLPPNC
jgi:hypothetical protein